MYKVKLSWNLGPNRDEWWPEVSAWVVETYGLSGGNYSTEISTECMIFKFKNEEDAILMKLRWGEYNGQ